MAHTYSNSLERSARCRGRGEERSECNEKQLLEEFLRLQKRAPLIRHSLLGVVVAAAVEEAGQENPVAAAEAGTCFIKFYLCRASSSFRMFRITAEIMPGLHRIMN